MNHDLIIINPDDISCYFSVDGKNYCVLIDSENEDNVDFALVSKLDDKHDVYTHVPEMDLEKVSAEFEKFLDFFNEADELDDDDDEGGDY